MRNNVPAVKETANDVDRVFLSKRALPRLWAKKTCTNEVCVVRTSNGFGTRRAAHQQRLLSDKLSAVYWSHGTWVDTPGRLDEDTFCVHCCTCDLLYNLPWVQTPYSSLMRYFNEIVYVIACGLALQLSYFCVAVLI